jgi:hypothetical protein
MNILGFIPGYMNPTFIHLINNPIYIMIRIRGIFPGLFATFFVVMAWVYMIYTTLVSKPPHDFAYWVSTLVSFIGVCIIIFLRTDKLTPNETTGFSRENDVAMSFWWSVAFIGIGFLVFSLSIQFGWVSRTNNAMFIAGLISNVLHITAGLLILFQKIYPSGIAIRVFEDDDDFQQLTTMMNSEWPALTIKIPNCFCCNLYEKIRLLLDID